MDLAPDFKELLAEFAQGGVEAVIVGGYAVAYHGRPRATKDIDLLIRGSTANLERAATTLAHFGAPASVVSAIRTMAETDVVYMGQPPLRIDFLRSIDAVDTDDVFTRAVTSELDGVPVRVIALDDLIKNKRAVNRPQDVIDADFLEKVRAHTK